MVCAFLRAPAALLALAVFLAPARAQEPSASHLAAAREFMDTIGVLNPVNELIPTFTDQVRKQNVARPELSKDLEDVLKSLQPEMQLQRQQVTNIVSRTYAKWLTEPELKELTVFFKTPLGAKYNKIQPELVEDVVNDVQVWTQQASEYVMVRVRAEMAKKGHQLQ
ncbi:DUF2059 domain-containing protein [Enterovirga aerilata]|uniref:DUF2059 domain-containing protein n=1 Tax=Enterovirga aerilata TaxID=2730920 RepID=A0A849I843_9HYPH|nr:DUF2059 domain-containing protein [Enterovirga sp. DB1703]NNM72465.1 DUF2059 domain-containing protein [Enterovirga sp. DB1703]